jgi:hypothetical protein
MPSFLPPPTVSFGSFILDFDRPLQEFGFGLGFAVLVDALVIRSLPMPAIMHLIGPANWAMPSWLGRVLPNLSAEVDEDAIPLPPSEEPVARRVSKPATPSSSRQCRAGITGAGRSVAVLIGAPARHWRCRNRVSRSASGGQTPR